MQTTNLTRTVLTFCFTIALALLAAAAAQAAPLELLARKAAKPDRPGEPATVTTEQLVWPPEKTAIIIIDMWDKHHCRSAEARVAEMAPAMNRAVDAARRRGVFVIHAPSDCMEFYAGTPQRRRAIEAPPAKTPVKFQWNKLDARHEGPLADEVATAGCSCDSAEPCGPDYRAWKRQIDAIEIAAEDAVSDSGQEIFNMLRQRGIEHVIVMGVHTNVCVLGRPFGIRQLVYLDQDVVLCRDLTDSYHRRVAASHFDGLKMIVRHIEQYWCATITSTALTGEPPFRFAEADHRGVEVAVLSPDTWDEYAPQGKEADCIYGDVVLRNDRITAVIARPVAGRHANMTVRNVGGAVIDLTSAAEPNDQLSAYYPGGPGMNWRAMTIDDGDGQKTLADVEAGRVPLRAAEVRVTCRAETSDAQPAAEVTYILPDGADWLRVETAFENGGDKDRELVLKDELRADGTFEKSGSDPGRLFSVYDKWFGQAYGIVAEGHALRCQSDARNSIIHYLEEGSERVALAPGKALKLVRQIAPAAHLLALQTLAGELLDANEQDRKIVVRDSNDAPLAAAELVVRQGDAVYGSGRTDRSGAIEFAVPDGEFEAIVSSLGSGSKTLKLTSGENCVELPAAGSVVADIRDADERPIACKVQFRGKDGAKDPDFGHQTGEWAVRNVRYSEQGQFRQPLPPGKYQAVISHGPEYDAVFTDIEVVQGRQTPLTARLARSVQTPGWISADFHNHASPSGDNTSSQLGRVLNLLAEHIEFAPCTEHNRLSSYEPHLVRLKATEQMGTCVGIELTDSPLPINHHNAFPLVARPHTQDNGGPLPDHDMEVKVERLAMWDGGSEKLIQQNHP
ncbi:MAG TPA: isochorismatase family protein, partial [Pirellulales bacterium]